MTIKQDWARERWMIKGQLTSMRTQLNRILSYDSILPDEYMCIANALSAISIVLTEFSYDGVKACSQDKFIRIRRRLPNATRHKS